MLDENISIIIAAYNEEGNIVDTVKRVRNTLPKAEIIVVDDGSHDKTTEIVRSLKMKGVRTIRYSPNIGKGHAIRVGVESALHEVQAQVDADSQFPPEELPHLLSPIIKKEADIVFGSRFLDGSKIQRGAMTRMRHLANYVVSGFTSFLCGQKLTDVNAGFKAWRKSTIQNLDFRCPHFAYEPEIAILASKKGHKIAELPISYNGRQLGISNVKLIRDGIIIPLYLLRVKFFR